MRHWLPELAALPTAALQVQMIVDLQVEKKDPMNPNYMCRGICFTVGVQKQERFTINLVDQSGCYTRLFLQASSFGHWRLQQSRPPVPKAYGRQYLRKALERFAALTTSPRITCSSAKGCFPHSPPPRAPAYIARGRLVLHLQRPRVSMEHALLFFFDALRFALMQFDPTLSLPVVCCPAAVPPTET